MFFYDLSWWLWFCKRKWKHACKIILRDIYAKLQEMTSSYCYSTREDGSSLCPKVNWKHNQKVQLDIKFFNSTYNIIKLCDIYRVSGLSPKSLLKKLINIGGRYCALYVTVYSWYYWQCLDLNNQKGETRIQRSI